MNKRIIAIPLAEPACSEVERICYGVPNIQWVEPQSLHVTIKYLKTLSSSEEIELIQSLKTLTLSPFEITLQGLVIKHNKHKNGSLQLSILPTKQLEDFSKEIEKHLKNLSIDYGKQSSHFHLTVGYYKNLRPEHLTNFIEANTYFKSSPTEVTTFCIMTPHHTPKHSFYTKDESFYLTHPNKEDPPSSTGFKIPRTYLPKK